MRLNKLQFQFLNALLSEVDDSVLSNIRTNGLSVKRRLQIYRNNFVGGLTEALQAIYPKIKQLVGEDFFNYTADCYIHAYPSVSSDLRNYGSHFSEFLRTFSHASSLPYLPDMAQLEWMVHEVFHAGDAPSLNLTTLSTLSTELYNSIRFHLHPASKLFSSIFPILQIWQICLENTNNEKIINLETRGIELLIIRRELEIAFDVLTQPEFAFLSVCSNNGTLTEACDAALKIDSGFDVTTCLQQHILRGNIIGLS